MKKVKSERREKVKPPVFPEKERKKKRKVEISMYVSNNKITISGPGKIKSNRSNRSKSKKQYV